MPFPEAARKRRGDVETQKEDEHEYEETQKELGCANGTIKKEDGRVDSTRDEYSGNQTRGERKEASSNRQECANSRGEQGVFLFRPIFSLAFFGELCIY